MINRNDVIRMALEADFCVNDDGEISTSNSYGVIRGELDRFAALVVAHEREAIANEFWMSVQSDLEHGVKSLNEKASSDFHKNYPSLVSFMDWLNKRGENDD